MYTPPQYFQVTMASGDTFSSWVTLNTAYNRVFLETPTMTSGSEMYINVSYDASTSKRLMHEIPQTATIQVNTFTIASAATSRVIPLPVGSFKYVRVEHATVQSLTSGVYRFHCS